MMSRVLYKNLLITLFSMSLVSGSVFASNTISVINYNVSGHLSDYSHTEESYEKVFRNIKKGSMDFIGTVEMLPRIEQTFADALGAANSAENSSTEFHYIGRVRGGISGQSEDEMVSIFYNTEKWQLKEYNTLEENPVLNKNCNNYTFTVPNKPHKPCELALNHFKPNENQKYHYTFPLNYVDNNNRNNYFPGDIKNEWGPWNRIATFGVFTSTEASGLPSKTTVIVIAAHFPKGKENDVNYKKNAFEAVYDFVIKPLVAVHKGASIIFMGDLNYKPNRDRYFFDLLEHIKGKSYFSGSPICGNDDEVLWTVSSPNLQQLECDKYPISETFNTTDHIITQTIFQLKP